MTPEQEKAMQLVYKAIATSKLPIGTWHEEGQAMVYRDYRGVEIIVVPKEDYKAIGCIVRGE